MRIYLGLNQRSNIKAQLLSCPLCTGGLTALNNRFKEQKQPPHCARTRKCRHCGSDTETKKTCQFTFSWNQLLVTPNQRTDIKEKIQWNERKKSKKMIHHEEQPLSIWKLFPGKLLGVVIIYHCKSNCRAILRNWKNLLPQNKLQYSEQYNRERMNNVA